MNRYVRTVTGERKEVGATGGFGLQGEVPKPLRVCNRCDLLLMEAGQQVRSGSGPAPDVNGAIALQDRMIGEDVGQLNFGMGCHRK